MGVLLNLVFTLIQRHQFDRRFIRQVDAHFVKEMATFAAPLIPLAMMSWLNSSVSLVVLSNLMDASAVGIYTSALVLASTVNVIQTGFNTYWAPYVYEHYRQDDKASFYTVHRLMACLLVGFGLTVTLLQAPVYLLLGERFRGSVIYFPFLFLPAHCYCLSETTAWASASQKDYWIRSFPDIAALTSVVFFAIRLSGCGRMAAAGAAVVALVIRTAVGERYYKAITDYRYLVYTITLILLASVANFALRGQTMLKYGVLIALYGLALWLFRREIAALWGTFQQITREGVGVLKRKAAQSTNEGERK